MAWIELHQSLPTHKKTLAAADILDMAPVHFMGHITCFWLWALDNVPDGGLDGISPRMIARAAQWESEPEDFINALIETGFIDQTDNGLVIHDWYDYAGKLLERRKQEDAYKKKQRALYGNMRVIKAVRKRDGSNCRYCGKEVDWDNRRGADGGTYDHVNPAGENSVINIVVACRACATNKGDRTPEEAGMSLLLPKTEVAVQDYASGSNQVETDRKQVESKQVYGSKNLLLPYSTVPNSTCTPPYSPPPRKGGDDNNKNAEVLSQSQPGESLLVETATGEPKTVSHSKTRKRRRKAELSAVQRKLFNKFWSTWPYKVSKGQAETAWAKLDPDEEFTEKIIAGVQRAKKYDRRFQPGGYKPHPSTWLNAKGWEDEFPDREVNNGAKHQRYTAGHFPSAFGNAKPQNDRFAGLVRDGGTGCIVIAGQANNSDTSKDSTTPEDFGESPGDNESHQVSAGLPLALAKL